MSHVHLNIALSHTQNLNRRVGIGQGDTPTRAEYLEYITGRLPEFSHRHNLTLLEFEMRDTGFFYDSILRFDLPSNDKRAARDVVHETALAVSRSLPSTDFVEATSVVAGKITFLSNNLKANPREPSIADLSKLGDATSQANLTLPWFNDLINSRHLQVDTLTDAVRSQLVHMTSVLADARSSPFTGKGGNKTHREQTAVRFMNLGARNSQLADVIRRHILQDQNEPETIIDEFSLVLKELEKALKTSSFDYKPAPLHPLSEIHRLAATYGPTLERGGAQMSPAYLNRVLEQFPKDTMNGNMLRFGMFLATHLANEIREGMGGTENMVTLHERLASDFGTSVVQPIFAQEEEEVRAPTI